MKSIIVFVLLLACAFSSMAQDLIIKKSGDTIQCKVSELSAFQVKYYYPQNPKLIFGIDNDLVDKVVFGSGEEVVIGVSSFKNPEYYAGQAKNALKVNFLSPLFGSTEFAYERVRKPGSSWEVALGLVGLGGDVQMIEPRGVYGKFAWKLLRDPDYYIHRMRYAHLLKGAYFAPEFALRYMSYDGTSWDWYNGQYDYTVARERLWSAALMLKFGKQWVFNNAFLIDTYVGLGYGVGADEEEGLSYGFLVAPEEFPIALTSGIRIGWVFGQK